MKLSVLYVILICAFTGSVGAQSIDWLPRIPLMQTGWQTPGTWEVVEDSTRDRLMTVGWRLGSVFQTANNGETWQGVYALGTDVVGKRADIYVAPDGRYLWHGLTPWNQAVALKSTDGGVTWGLYTRDTSVLKDGSYRGLNRVIPPTSIRAFNATGTGYVISSDLGDTWRSMSKPPSDTTGVINVGDEIQVAPYILYFRGNPYRFRFDTRLDTVWTETRVDRRAREVAEVGGAVVAMMGNGFRMYASYADTSSIDVTTWRDTLSGLDVALSIQKVLRLDDSTAYAVDVSGWVFEVRPKNGSVRCIQPFGAPFPVAIENSVPKPRLVYAITHGNRCVVVYGFTLQNHDTARVWRVAEIVNGVVDRVDTVLSRNADVIVNYRFPLTYLGKRGLFMFTISNQGFREVVRSTNLGRTWTHIARIESEELEPTFVGIRSTVRDADGTLLAHTMRDHCVELREDGAVEFTQRLTGLESTFRTDQQTLFGYYPTLQRDEHRVLMGGRVLAEYDYKSGRYADTIVPLYANVFRRLSATMLAIGRDSLWLSFDNGKEWIYVSSTLTSPVLQERGQFSDVCRTSTGTLLAAVRGVDYKHTGDRRGIIRYGGIARSVDDGNTWQWVSALPDSMRFVARIERVNDSTVLAVAGRMLFDSALIVSEGRLSIEVDASAILISTDDGASWSVVQRDIRTGMPRTTLEPDICVLENGAVLASVYSGNAFVSVTRGTSWSLLDLPEIGQGTVQSFREDGDGLVVVSTSIGAGYLRLPGVTSAENAENNAVPTKPLAYVSGHMLHINIAPTSAIVRLVALDGRCIYEQAHGNGTTSLSITGYARGVYGVELISAGSIKRTIIVW